MLRPTRHPRQTPRPDQQRARFRNVPTMDSPAALGRYRLAIVAMVLGLAHVLPLQTEIARALSEPGPYLPFAAGGAAYVALRVVLFRGREPFFRILEHEALHALVATLTLRPVMAIQVMRGRGGLMQSLAPNGRSSALVTLAPYIVPATALAVAVLRVFVTIPLARTVISVALGYATLYYIASVLREARPWQPDIKQVGVMTAYLTIAGFAVCWLVYLAALSARGPDALPEVGASAWESLWPFLERGARAVLAGLKLLVNMASGEVHVA